MIPEEFISISDVIKTATAEQKIMWQQVRLIVGGNAAIRQLYQTGVNNAGELTVYLANKLYLCLELDISLSGNISATEGTVTFYDSLNAQNYVAQNRFPVWDVTAAAMRFTSNRIEVKNILFSRLSSNLYSYYKFIGYRIIY